MTADFPPPSSRARYRRWLFLPEGCTPSLPHEYQFNVDTAAGREALERILGFLEERFNAEESSR